MLFLLSFFSCSLPFGEKSRLGESYIDTKRHYAREDPRVNGYCTSQRACLSRRFIARRGFAALNERAPFLPAPKAMVNIDASSSSPFSPSTLACRGGKAGVATAPRGRIRALTIFAPPLRSPDTFSCAYCYDRRFARRFAVGSFPPSLSLFLCASHPPFLSVPFRRSRLWFFRTPRLTVLSIHRGNIAAISIRCYG